MVLSNDSPPPVSWPPHFDKPAARCGASTQELFLFPSRCPRTESSGRRKTCRGRFQKLRTLPKTRSQNRTHFLGPELGPPNQLV